MGHAGHVSVTDVPNPCTDMSVEGPDTSLHGPDMLVGCRIGWMGQGR